ncbi:amidase family protein [Kordiimonas aquimaris]|uniref:amidase family protein n=1 Tax=Kordiimonas aquimaris TaxID=707591 RepID=UPI0021D124B5|nr:amidase family protein [Kordiimonas aquimaris]
MVWSRVIMGVSLCLGVAACEEVAPAPFSFVEATIADVHQAITSGQMTCEQVVSGYVARIEAHDKSSGLNAITNINAYAINRARETDTSLRNGEQQGPLFCVPILVKDNFDTHDMPTTGGSIALKDSYPPDDAFMVRKLRAAGAIIVAKTNMAEWAFSPRQTVSSSNGTTANAYNLDRVPAGSSGGTASGIAASFAVAGMGTDTGNSIRGPSSHLALFGIRSTIGLTSRDGVIPLSFDWDIAGPMTRTVTDGAKLFNVVAGYDPADPFTELGKGKREADYTAFLDKDGLKGVRLGVLRALVDTDDADPQVIALFEKSLDDLRAAGAVIVDPFTVDNFNAHLNADVFCVRFRYDMGQYLKSLGENAPIKDVMEAYEAGQYSDYIKDGFEFFGSKPMNVHPEQGDPPCLDYPKHPARKAFKDDILKAMNDNNVDAVLYPSWTNPPAFIDKADEGYKGDNSQLVSPPSGLPAVTVPMGYSYGNLPAGLQILGAPYGEGNLIKYAYAYEQKTKHRKPPEQFAVE